MAYLSRVTAELGIHVSILTQDEEAEVGLATAEAYAGGSSGSNGASNGIEDTEVARNGGASGGGVGGGDAGAGGGGVGINGAPSLSRDQVISWDSGSGSFQFCTRVKADLLIYSGRLGTSPVVKVLVEEIRGGAYGKTGSISGGVNPVTHDEAAALIASLRRRLDQSVDWLAGKGSVIFIGGPNSLGSVIMRALAKDATVAGTITASDSAALLDEVRKPQTTCSKHLCDHSFLLFLRLLIFLFNFYSYFIQTQTHTYTLYIYTPWSIHI